MERTVRNLDDMTKQKISNAMKLKHQQRSESENGKQPRNKVKP